MPTLKTNLTSEQKDSLDCIVYLLNHELQEADVFRGILMNKNERKLAREIITDLIEKLSLVGIVYSENNYLASLRENIEQKT